MNVPTSTPSFVDQQIIDQLDQGRKLRRAWLGVSLLIVAGIAVFIALQ